MKINKILVLQFIAILFSLALSGCDGLLDPSKLGNMVPKTVVENPSIPAIELSGSRFHVETFGPEQIDVDPPILEAFIAEAGVSV